MSTVKSPLDAQARTTTGTALQGALVDLIDLSLQAKQAHWTLVGKNFRSLHLQLDDVVATARDHSDILAERAITVGVNPDGRAGTVAAQSQLPPIEAGYLADDKAVALVIDCLEGIVRRMRERIAATAEPDPVTQGLLIDASAELEKHYWMFQAER